MNPFKARKLPFLIYGICLPFLISSCKQNSSFIPNVPVNVVINTLDPAYQSLNGIGGWAYVDGGSKGLIVFQSDYQEYKAFDRHCSYNPENECSKISVDQTQLYAVDSCCNSKFQLIDGNPAEGPANIGLKQYNTRFDGNIIQIWN